MSPKRLLSELDREFDSNYYLHNVCSSAIRCIDDRRNLLASGLEARLCLLDWTPPESLYAIALRAGKHASISEISDAELFSLDNFSGKERSLTHLFCDSSFPGQRHFVSKSQSNPSDVYATASIRPLLRGFYHLEVFERSDRAPYGAVEHLLYGVISALQSEGADTLSLGEVPFVGRRILKRSSYSEFLHMSYAALGRFIAPRYNYPGLYNFKNKFRPTWLPLYFYARSGFAPSDLLTLSKHTGVNRLIASAALKRLHSAKKSLRARIPSFPTLCFTPGSSK